MSEVESAAAHLHRHRSHHRSHRSRDSEQIAPSADADVAEARRSDPTTVISVPGENRRRSAIDMERDDSERDEGEPEGWF